MLIEFKVSNSRSIGEEVTFSAIATDDESLPENTIDVPKYGIKLLKTMALFGANASGKSNFLKAIADAQKIICKPNYNEKTIQFNYNRNTKENQGKPTSYVFVFLIDGIVYDYSFSHNRTQIIEEQLQEYIDNKTVNTIYSRKYNFDTKKYDWQPESFFKDENTDFFRKLTAEHKLYLSISNNPVNPDAVDKNILLEKVYNWFSNQLLGGVHFPVVGKVDYRYFIKYIYQSETNKKHLLKILKEVDIPIVDIKILKIKSDSNTNFKTYKLRLNRGKSIEVIIQVEYKKGEKLEKFDFLTDESDGTRQFMAWLGAILFFSNNDSLPRIFFLDEIDVSLHPKLTVKLIKLFADREHNPNLSQVIFTTHEVKLMDKTVMRPDQLYLINRNNIGYTTIKRISDFNTEKYVSRIDNLYMSGGITGIPSIN